MEVIEDRSGLRSTVLTSQLPVAMWHEAIGEPTLADAVLDRLLENLQRVELQGDSMRKTSSGRARRQGAPGAPVVSCHVRSIDQREVSSGA